MGLPAVQGDNGVAYYQPPDKVASFPLLGGSTKVFVRGASVCLFGSALTGGGPIVSGAPTTTKTLVEGKLVYLIGAVTNLGTGWFGGTLVGASAAPVFMN